MITPSQNFWKIFKETNGALSCSESLAIMNIAAQAPKGNICVEFGVYKGKSAISAACVLENALFCLVEPEFEDKKWQDSVVDLLFKIKNDTVSILTSSQYSVDWLNDNHRGFGYVFIDSGSHQGGLPMQEVRLLEDKIIQGGIIAFHDYKNQFTEVEGAYDYLVGTGKYEPIHINWQEIFDYVAEHNLEEGNNSWHLYPELPHPPNFVGALRRK